MIVPTLLDWSSIETVFLDMDGTLLDLHFDSYFWLEHLPVRYAEIHQMEQGEAKAWLHNRIMQEVGTLNWYCLDYWTRELKVDIAGMKQEVADKIAFRPYVKDFLAAIKNQGKRVVIVTNAHRGSLDLKLEQTDLASRVDHIICSHDFGMAKEAPEFWLHLQKVEPFDKAKTLLIDDSLAVLNSAKSYGISHLLSIYQPDSQKPKRDIEGFVAIDHFDEITPKNDKF